MSCENLNTMIILYSINSMLLWCAIVSLISLTSIVSGQLYGPQVPYNNPGRRPLSNSLGNNFDNTPRHVLPQRVPPNQQKTNNGLKPNRPPMQSEQMRQIKSYQDDVQNYKQMSGQNQLRDQSKRPLQQNVRPIVPPQSKQQGTFYEHDKSTDNVKAYNYENVNHIDYPADQSLQPMEQPVDEGTSMHNNYGQQPIFYEEQMPYDHLGVDESQQSYNNNPQAIDQDAQDNHPDQTYNQTYDDNNHEGENLDPTDDTPVGSHDNSGNDSDGDKDDGDETDDYERQLQAELMRLKMERMKKKQKKHQQKALDEPEPDFMSQNEEEESSQFLNSQQQTIVPMSTNIAIYNNSPVGGVASSTTTGSQTIYPNGQSSYYQNYEHSNNDDDDISEDEDDRFITSASGKLRPRFVDPVRLGYLGEEDDDYVDADEIDHISAVDHDHDRGYFHQQQLRNNQQQSPKQQAQQTGKHAPESRAVGVTAGSFSSSASASAVAYPGPTNQQKPSAGMRVSYSPQPMRSGQPLVRPNQIQPARLSPQFQQNQQQKQQVMNIKRRYKRSPIDKQSDTTISTIQIGSDGFSNDSVRVVDILRRVKRCGGGGGDDDDDGNANSVRRGWGGGRRVNKSVKKKKKTVKSDKNSKKKNKKKNKKSKKKRTVKKIVTRKVIKNGQVQSVETSEHPGDSASDNGNGNDDDDSQLMNVTQTSNQKSDCDQSKQPTTVTQPGGQTIYIQTTPGKEVNTTSETSVVTINHPVEAIQQIVQQQDQPKQTTSTTSTTTMAQPTQ